MITISIVSHGNGAMVTRLVAQLEAFPQVSRLIVTLNVPEDIRLQNSSKTLVIKNPSPKGFAANNNAAFLHCGTDYFAVVNPDIGCPENPFQILLEALSNTSLGAVAPLIINPNGDIEITARRFPTIPSLLKKLFRGPQPDYLIERMGRNVPVQWIGGMFVLFRSADYTSVNGFDERYHLYYEDVDICARLSSKGKRVAICPSAFAVHEARRSSHRYWRYRIWHATSMLRFLSRMHY